MEKTIKNSIKDYVVDTTAAWSFYTPLMALSEYFIAGMESDEILASRLAGIAVQALVMRVYGKYRQWFADSVGVDEASSKTRKYVTDTAASILYQIPVYSSILAMSGASLDEALPALGAGLMIGAASGRPYGYCLDKWRKLWGRKATM